MNLHEFFWMLVCLSGNVYQLYWISGKYFKYDVTTVVQVAIPERIDAPFIIICVDYPYLFKWDKMTSKLRTSLLSRKGCKSQHGNTSVTATGNHIFTKSNHSKVDVTALNETIIVEEINDADEGELACLLENSAKLDQNILLNNTLHREDFIFFEPFDPDGELNLTTRNKAVKANYGVKVNYHKIRDINSSILVTDEDILDRRVGGKKCYTLKPQGKFSRNIDYISVRTSQFQRMSWMCVGLREIDPPREVKEFHIALCPPGKRKCGWELITKIKVEYKKSIHVTYTEYKSNLLPPPYVTKCRNYSRETIGGSRENCFLTCAKTVNKGGDDGNDGAWQYGIVDNCSRLCQEKDCSSTVIVPKTVQNMSPSCGRQWAGVSIVPPDTPLIQSDTEEQVALIQYLTDIGSSVGFWLGLSVLGIFEQFTEFFLRLIGRKAKAKNVVDIWAGKAKIKGREREVLGGRTTNNNTDDNRNKRNSLSRHEVDLSRYHTKSTTYRSSRPRNRYTWDKQVLQSILDTQIKCDSRYF